jgi:hypothetical protein
MLSFSIVFIYFHSLLLSLSSITSPIKNDSFMYCLFQENEKKNQINEKYFQINEKKVNQGRLGF